MCELLILVQNPAFPYISGWKDQDGDWDTNDMQWLYLLPVLGATLGI